MAEALQETVGSSWETRVSLQLKFHQHIVCACVWANGVCGELLGKGYNDVIVVQEFKCIDPPGLVKGVLYPCRRALPKE